MPEISSPGDHALAAAADALARHLLDSLPAGRAHGRDALATLPAPVARLVLSRLDARVDREAPAPTSAWVDADRARGAARAWRDAAREAACVPADAWPAFLGDACRLVVSHLVRPAETLAAIAFDNGEGHPAEGRPAEGRPGAEIPAALALRRLRAFAPYPYLPEIAGRYAERKGLARFDRAGLESLLRRIDRRMVAGFSADEWAEVLDPLMTLLGPVGASAGGGPTALLDPLLRAQGQDDLADALAGPDAYTASALRTRLGAALASHSSAATPAPAAVPQDPPPVRAAPDEPAPLQAAGDEGAFQTDSWTLVDTSAVDASAADASATPESPPPDASDRPDDLGSGPGRDESDLIAWLSGRPDAPDAEPDDRRPDVRRDAVEAPLLSPPWFSSGPALSPIGALDETPVPADEFAGIEDAQEIEDAPETTDARPPADEPLWRRMLSAEARPEGLADGASATRPEPGEGAEPLWMRFVPSTHPPTRAEPVPPRADEPAAEPALPSAQVPDAAPPGALPPLPVWFDQPPPYAAPLSDSRTSDDQPYIPPPPIAPPTPPIPDKTAPEIFTASRSGGPHTSGRPDETEGLDRVEARALGASPDASRRAWFVAELFAGSEADYHETLAHLAAAETWTEATEVIARDVFRKHRVNIYSEPAIVFTDAAEARFSRHAPR